MTLMDRRPLVSIIIPAYNHEKYINDCLDSVAAEEYPSLEVIVLDDGSTDSTFSAAVEWQTENSKRFSSMQVLQQENRGVAKTLNTLIGLTSGAYVVPLASDDRLAQGGLKVRIEALEANPHWLVVIGDCAVIDSWSNRIADSACATLYGANRNALADPTRIRAELLTRWSVPGPAAMLRRVTYVGADGVGLYDESLMIEDREFFLRLLARGALGYIPHVVGEYRLHGLNSIRPVSRSQRAALHRCLAESETRHVGQFRGLDAKVLSASARFQAAAADFYEGLSMSTALKLLGTTLFYRFLAAILRARRSVALAST
jgi:glycosyltransferase involved in cell wall biosynthesis